MKKTMLFLLGLAGGALAGSGAQAGDEQLARGAKLATTLCAECHGPDGRGVSSGYPSLAGQHVDYIVKQIFNFKTGQRRNEEMAPVLEKLLAADVRAVARYYSTQVANVVPASNQALLDEGRRLYFGGNPATGISACVTCHGSDATGGAAMPRLAGQHPTYLSEQMQGFIARVRHNDRMMHVSMARMTKREVRAVAVFLGNEE